MSEPITLSAEGYDELAIILRDAFKQASEGKGRERHANDMPFDQQPMQTLSDMFDSDKGMAFQVVKKLREGLDMPEYDRMERELLGSIVYTAGIILWHKRRRDTHAPDETSTEIDMSIVDNWRPGDVIHETRLVNPKQCTIDYVDDWDESMMVVYPGGDRKQITFERAAAKFRWVSRPTP